MIENLNADLKQMLLRKGASLVGFGDISELIKDEEKGTPSPSKANKTGLSRQIIYVVLGLLLCLMLIMSR